MRANEEMPDWIEPMAATLTQERVVGDDWLFERKFDGIRLLAYKRGGDVRLYLAQSPSAGVARRRGGCCGGSPCRTRFSTVS